MNETDDHPVREAIGAIIRPCISGPVVSEYALGQEDLAREIDAILPPYTRPNKEWP